MDWFERLTGFREKSYADTKTKLVVDNGYLRSLINGKSYRVGALELVSLRVLRERVKQECPPSAKSKAILGSFRFARRRTSSRLMALSIFMVANSAGKQVRRLYELRQRGLKFLKHEIVCEC